MMCQRCSSAVLHRRGGEARKQNRILDESGRLVVNGRNCKMLLQMLGTVWLPIRVTEKIIY